MNTAQDCFHYLIDKTQKSPSLNDAQKEVILKDLQYFLEQLVS